MPLTDEQLECLDDTFVDIYETPDGEVVINPQQSHHSHATYVLGRLLDRALSPSFPAYQVRTEFPWRMGDGRLTVPDVIVIDRPQWDDRAKRPSARGTGVPLVCEISSATTRSRDRADKADDYWSAGARLYLLVDLPSVYDEAARPGAHRPAVATAELWRRVERGWDRGGPRTGTLAIEEPWCDAVIDLDALDQA